jgi:putative ABC transport system permease protein
MRAADLLALAFESIRFHRLRTALTLTGIVVGVLAVLLLTALGEGARDYVVREFTDMGSALVVVLPGRVETQGAGTFASTGVRDLTIGDADAIARRVPAARRVAPLAYGSAGIEFGGRSRQVMVLGSTPELLPVRNLSVAAGRFLSEGDIARNEDIVVIGRTVQREVFGGESPLGKPVRIGGYRLRVVGVLAHKGTSLGVDMDDVIILPVNTAMRMFNQRGLFRILVQATSADAAAAAEEQVRAVMKSRHDDEEDFTVIAQSAMLAAFRSILDTLTAALAGIAAISLAVAGIGIMNVMLVSVSERRGEVGLLKAVGARRRQILTLFLVEAVALAGGGAVAGIVLGVLLILAVGALFPAFPFGPSAVWIVAVAVLCLLVGTVFGILPARRAAGVAAADALRSYHR